MRLDKLTKKSVILITLCASPLFFISTYLGDPGRGRAAIIGAAIIAVCARMFWDLNKQIWFWLALAIAVLCNGALLVFVRWNKNDYPGVVLLPVALPDFALVYGAFKLVERIAVSEQISQTKRDLKTDNGSSKDSAGLGS